MMEKIIFNRIEGFIEISKSYDPFSITVATVSNPYDPSSGEFNPYEFSDDFDDSYQNTIYYTYNTPTAPTFSQIGQTFTATYSKIGGGIQCFTNFSYNASDIIKETRYLDTFYKLSRDGTNWTDWLILDANFINFPPFDARYYMYIAIQWIRHGTNPTGVITLNDFILKGKILRNVTDGLSPVTLNNKMTYPVIIKPPFIYKVFSITGIEILGSGDMSNVSIKYRFSQDYGRTVSQWEPFTQANITTVRINPIRFFQIEYLLEYTGNSSALIVDINLIGTLQNVTKDYTKTNLYGIREMCSSDILGLINGSPIPGITYSSVNGFQDTTSANCSPSTTKTYTPMTPDQKNKLFKPYQQDQAIQFLNKMSNDSVNVFGFDVVYFLTDPDKNGIDYSFHEYQLFNYICEKDMKISVDKNAFPDNQIVMNEFDLSLFEQFEVHITKENFKLTFGAEKRPNKEDFLWFCEINRMFQIDHVQQFRNFNNAALYYKVMLKKYTQKAHIIGANRQIVDKVNQLTQNTTIQDLMGMENIQDIQSNSNKLQYEPLTVDRIRLTYNVGINKELIENSSNIISKTNYDMSSVPPNSPAVIYNLFKNWFKPSDNIGFACWFNINNYAVNDSYNFFNYYNNITNYGIDINLQADQIIVDVNAISYTFSFVGVPAADAIVEDVWYAYVLNIDQRQGTISQYLYKRDVENESDAGNIATTKLLNLYNNTQTFTPTEFQVDGINAQILGSDIKLTNIRLFNDVIPEDYQSNLLNQAIIGADAKYLIFGDNANTKLYLPNIPFGQQPVGSEKSVNLGHNSNSGQVYPPHKQS